MAEAADRLAKLYGAGMLPRPVAPSPPDAWDLIVGIPLDDWRRATTVTELEWLTHLRDHPMPRACDEPAGPDDIEVYTFGDRKPVHVIRGRR